MVITGVIKYGLMINGTSSQSGFVKVVRIGDGNNPYLQIVVPDTPVGKDPIDSLQTMFNDWKLSLYTTVDPFLSQIEISPDTLPANGTSTAVIMIIPKNNSDTLLASGLQVLLSNTGAGTLGTVVDLGDGTYESTITAPIGVGSDTITAVVISGTDTVSIFSNAFVTYESPTLINDQVISLNSYYLYQNSPNPFNPTTIIKYQIPKEGFVSLKIIDALGKEVATLVRENKSAGRYEIEFNANNLSSGIYFYTLNAGEYSDTKKMILIK